MVCAPVRSIIPSLKLGNYLSVQAHKPCSISHIYHMTSIYVIFSQHLLRLVYDVTSYVICIMTLWLLVHNFRARVSMKFNAPIIYIPNDKTFFTSLDNTLTKRFLRFAWPLFCWLIMIQRQNSYFAEKGSILRK